MFAILMAKVKKDPSKMTNPESIVYIAVPISLQVILPQCADWIRTNVQINHVFDLRISLTHHRKTKNEKRK